MTVAALEALRDQMRAFAAIHPRALWAVKIYAWADDLDALLRVPPPQAEWCPHCGQTGSHDAACEYEKFSRLRVPQPSAFQEYEVDLVEHAIRQSAGSDGFIARVRAALLRGSAPQPPETGS